MDQKVKQICIVRASNERKTSLAGAEKSRTISLDFLPLVNVEYSSHVNNYLP